LHLAWLYGQDHALYFMIPLVFSVAQIIGLVIKKPYSLSNTYEVEQVVHKLTGVHKSLGSGILAKCRRASIITHSIHQFTVFCKAFPKLNLPIVQNTLLQVIVIP